MLLTNALKLSCSWNGRAARKIRHIYKGLIRNYNKNANENPTYDVVVVGGGQAGVEAASAAARMGCKTLLVTRTVETIGKMVGSPSMGGAGSGHLIREIDALDGICGRMCDISGIHYMVVNKHRNPGLWGPKAYVDQELYSNNVQRELLGCQNLETRATTVENLIVSDAKSPQNKSEQYRCSGVVLADGSCISSKTVVLAVGTSLGPQAQTGLEASLVNLGFKLRLLKLGIAPRLDGSTVDFTQLNTVSGDRVPAPFSFMNDSVWIEPQRQVPSYIARTNPAVEELIQDCIQQRRCVDNSDQRATIDDTTTTLAKRGRQQVWLEPEGLDQRTIYLGGFSCPLSEDKQVAMIRQLSGLEKATVINPAYDLTYKFVDPRQVTTTMESRSVSNLFMAGHLLGTAGCEEAAALGIVAGVNAGCKAQQREPFVVKTSDGYIGILIHDISTHGIGDRPYAVALCSPELSSVLRPDNADMRLSEKAKSRGCISQQRQQHAANMQQRLKEAINCLSADVRPINEWLLLLEHSASKDEIPKSALEMFSLSTTDLESLVSANPDKFQFLLKDVHFTARLKIEASFQLNALEHEHAAEELKNSASVRIPEDIGYKSTELKLSPTLQQMFTDVKPRTLEDASRLKGVTQDHLFRLLKFIKKHHSTQKIKLKKRRQKL